MAAMGRGCGKTPERIVLKITEEVARIGQNATAKAVGIPLRSVQKYLKGEAEPTLATLQKLAKYFNKDVLWFRDEHMEGQKQFSLKELKELKDLLELYPLTPEHLKGTVLGLIELTATGDVGCLVNEYLAVSGEVVQEAERIIEIATNLIRAEHVKEMKADRERGLSGVVIKKK